MTQRHYIGAAIILAILWYDGKIQLPNPNPTPTPAPVTPDTPNAELQAAVRPVQQLLAGHADADKFVSLCRGFAYFIGSPNCKWKTNSDLRTAWGNASEVMNEGKGGPAGLAAAVDSVLASQLGTDPSTAIDKAKAMAVYNALAWAGGFSA